ncbi:MAG: porin family protein [Bacteroidota bacterium]|nr:porin family protein [Bacteroidota bacterium]
MNAILKSFLLVNFLLIVSSAGAFCQSKETFLGIEGGGGVSFVRNYFFSSVSGNLSMNYNVGIFGQFPLNKTLAIKPVVAIHEKGYAEENSSNTKNLLFLDIPVLLKISFGPKKYFYFETGPYFAYLIRAESKNSFASGEETSNSYNNYRHFDGGLALGFGAMFPVYKNLNLSVDIRDEYGFCDIQEKYLQYDLHGNSYNATTPYYTNSTFLNIGIAYRFGSD